LRSSTWYGASLDFPSSGSKTIDVSRNAFCSTASRNERRGKKWYSLPSVSCSFGARDVVATHRPKLSGNFSTSASSNAVFPIPGGPQIEMILGGVGRLNLSLKNTVGNA
jgi:hypothetical protein